MSCCSSCTYVLCRPTGIRCFLCLTKTIHPTTQVSEEVDRKLPARNTTFYDFNPLYRSWMPQCTALQTDGGVRTDILWCQELQYDRDRLKQRNYMEFHIHQLRKILIACLIVKLLLENCVFNILFCISSDCCKIFKSEWVSSFLTAHQHIKGHSLRVIVSFIRTDFYHVLCTHYHVKFLNNNFSVNFMRLFVCMSMDAHSARK